MFSLSWIWENLKGYQCKFVVGMIIAVIFPMTSVIAPQIAGYIVDNILIGVPNASGEVIKQTQLLIPLALLMILISFIRTAIGYTMVVLMDDSAFGCLVNVRKVLYKKLQFNDQKFFNEYATGDIMTRLTGDVEMIRHCVAWVFRNAVQSSVQFVSCAVLFFIINPKITLIIFLVTPIIAVSSYLYIKKVGPMYGELRDKLSALNTYTQENISGNRVVKAFANEQLEIDQFDVKNKEYKDSNLATVLVWLECYPIIEISSQIIQVIILLVGGIFMMKGELSAGEFAILSSLNWMMTEPIRSLGMILNDIQRFFASSQKVMEVYFYESEIESKENAVCKSKDTFKGDIEFSDVTLCFDETVVLENINFKIKHGQTVAIMGETGAGKTMLINAMLRFYDVKSGSVKIDNIDVRDWNLSSLRSNIGVATQDVFLFSDTVEGNIAYGNQDISLEEVKSVANQACATFVEDMEDGFDTIIGERGVGLSGGQKQRLALARALAIKPSILILDDTTSAVDMETEKKIQQNLENLDFTCTKIIIAQRISSVKDADNIIILEGGAIKEQGTHKQLIDLKGLYYEFYKIQSNLEV